MSVLCEKILFMDVYGLIYQKGLVGALRYANDMDSVNPSLSAKIDSAVKEIMILAGIKSKNKFTKTAQEAQTPTANPQKGTLKLPTDRESINQIIDETNLIKETYLKQRAALNLRSDNTYELNEGVLEKVVRSLSLAGKIPFITVYMDYGWGLRQILNACGLASALYNDVIMSAKKIGDFQKELNNYAKSGYAGNVAKKFSELNFSKRQAAEAIDIIRTKFPDDKILHAAITDLYRNANELNPHFSDFMKSEIANLKKSKNPHFHTLDKIARLETILGDGVNKTTAEVRQLFREVDAQNFEHNKNLVLSGNKTRPLETDFLAKFDKFFNNSADTVGKLNEVPNKIHLNQATGKQKTKIVEMIEKILGTSVFGAKIPPGALTKIVPFLNGAMNIASIWHDLSSLYAEYQRTGVTAGFSCRVVAAIANIISMIPNPTTWAIGAAVNLILNFGVCGAADVNEGKNKRLDNAREFSIIKDYQNNDPNAAAIFESATDNVKFTDLNPQDQALLKELFSNKNQKGVDVDLYNQIRQSMQQQIINEKLQSPFKTYRIFLEEMINLKKAINTPNATINWMIPKDENSKIFTDQNKA
jgi:hypothetical protein